MSTPPPIGLAIRGVVRAAFGDFLFVAVPDRKQHVFRVVQVAALLAVIFVNVGFDDRIDRATLLAETAENALGEIDVVARRAARAVGALFGFDRDRQRRTDCFTQFARNAALFAVGVAAQRVQAAKARAGRRLLFR